MGVRGMAPVLRAERMAGLSASREKLAERVLLVRVLVPHHSDRYVAVSGYDLGRSRLWFDVPVPAAKSWCTSYGLRGSALIVAVIIVFGTGEIGSRATLVILGFFIAMLAASLFTPLNLPSSDSSGGQAREESSSAEEPPN
jgi:hypothetical protein